MSNALDEFEYLCLDEDHWRSMKNSSFQGRVLLFTQNDVSDPRVDVMRDETDVLMHAWKSVFAKIWFAPEFVWRSQFDAVHLIASDFADFGLQVAKNMVRNSQLKIKDGTALFGAYENQPAIVCGAGPSLNLPAIEKSNALILACGTAMKLLKSFHFGVASDPVAEIDVGSAPLFFEPRVSNALLRKSGGEKLCLCSAGLHLLERWLFRGKMGVDTGWSCGCFGFSIAKKLGCDPIYISGMDGGLVDGKRYYGDLEGVDEERDLNLSRKWMGDAIQLPKEGIKSDFTFALPETPFMETEAVPENFVESELFEKLVLEPNWEVWKHVMARKLDASDAAKQALFMRIKQEYAHGL